VQATIGEIISSLAYPNVALAPPSDRKAFMSAFGGRADSICSSLSSVADDPKRHRPAFHVAVAAPALALSKHSFEPIRYDFGLGRGVSLSRSRDQVP